MTAEVSQTYSTSTGPGQPPQPQEAMEKQIEDKVLEEARSIFRKFSITLGTRKNSTKSARSLEGVGEEASASAQHDATVDKRLKEKNGKDGEVPPGPDAPREQQDSQDNKSLKNDVRMLIGCSTE